MQRYNVIHAESMPGGDWVVSDTDAEPPRVIQQGCKEQEARDLADELNRHGIDQAATLRKLVKEARCEG